jgi:hypothetical protein
MDHGRLKGRIMESEEFITGPNGVPTFVGSDARKTARIQEALAQVSGKLVKHEASPAQHEPHEPEATDDREAKARAYLSKKEADLAAREARLAESDHTTKAQREELAERRAQLEELQRLQRERPVEFAKRLGGNLRELMRDAWLEDRLSPEQRAAREEQRATKRELAELRGDLKRREEADTRAIAERAEAEGVANLRGLLAGEAHAAGLKSSQLNAIAERGWRWCRGFYDQHGRAPKPEELATEAQRWPEFSALVTKRLIAQHSPVPRAQPKPTPQIRKPRAPRKPDELVADREERLRAALRVAGPKALREQERRIASRLK